MKKTTSTVLLAGALIAPLAPAAPAAAPAQWEAEVRSFDDAYWAAYNRCDVPALHAMNSADLEFYHDVGGVMRGQAAFDAAMAQNICANPARKVRREAIAGSVQVYPMLANGKIYGAVIEGGHQFYSVTPGAADVLTGRARFSSLLLLEGGAWKLARALSYGHAPAQSEVKLAEVNVAPAALAALAGQYTATDKMVLTVTPAGKHLMVQAGANSFELYPTGPDNFAMRERAIQISFTRDARGKGQGLVVREHGAVVAQATADK